MLKKFILLAFFCSLGTGQQVTGDSLLKMLDRAKVYYNNGEYENAIKQLEVALQYLKQLNQNEQVEAYKYLAFSYVAFGNKEKAKEQFKKALSLDPKLELDPATVSPKIIKVFEEAKAEMVPVVSPPAPPSPKPVQPAVQSKSVSISGALLRSCCLPGWGQLYKGESSKGKKMAIAAVVLFPTTLLATSIQNARHEDYLNVEPGNEDEMDRAYNEYRLWYNISAICWLSYLGLYGYNIYDVLTSKPGIKSSMLEEKNFYCIPDYEGIQFGYNFKIK
ncbi:MAG: tetratricopeptide repeat protein [candidate division WOR-3 bacterium]|nr:tetratricopeptide repeat protein [candidate division WOR-3 bacterium]